LTELAALYANAILGLNGTNQNGLPTSFDAAEANGPFAKKTMVELERSTDPNFVAITAALVQVFGIMLKGMDPTGRFQVDYETISEHLQKKVVELDPTNYKGGFVLASTYLRQAQ